MCGGNYQYEPTIDDHTFQGALIKLNNAGHVVWSRLIGNEWDEYFRSVKPTSDGGYIACGYGTSFNSNTGYGGLVAKMDASGNPVWSKLFSEKYIGENFADIIQDGDGNYIACGTSVDNTSETSQIYLIKLSSGGSVLWSYTYPFNGNFNASAAHLALAGDGNYAIAGAIIYPSSTKYDALLMKVNKSGAFMWSKSYGNTNASESSYGLVKTKANGFAILSPTDYFKTTTDKSDIMLLVTDSVGTLLRHDVVASKYQDEAWALGKSIPSDNGFFVAGRITPTTGNPIMITIKFDENGKKLWARKWTETVTPAYYPQLNSIVENSDKTFMVAGTSYLVQRGIFYGRLNSLGNSCNGAKYSTLSRIYAMVTTQPDAAPFFHATDSSVTLAVSSFTSETTICSAASPASFADASANSMAGLSASIYPNPVYDKLVLTVTSAKAVQAVVTIIDKNGRIYSSKNINLLQGKSYNTFDVSSLPSGMYLLNIKTSNSSVDVKFLKE